MIDQFASAKSSAAHEPLEARPKHLAQQSPAGVRNELQFFGKDGFTFLDLLDVINPLQHIPIISTLYRSISGDTIDPGAKIAGGTLFGGPLGAAISALDVAVKHKTGRDITDHAAAFFNNTTSNENAPTLSGTSLKTAALETTQLAERPNRGQAAVSVVEPTEDGHKSPPGETLYPWLPETQISEDRFQAAGMAAIPIAKRPSSGYGQEATNAIRPIPDPVLLGDIAEPAPPLVLSERASNNEAINTEPSRLTHSEPYRLKSKFSGNAIPTAFTELRRTPQLSQPSTGAFLKSTEHLYGATQDINQITTYTKNNWIADAMRRGLNKYEAANNLTPGSNQNSAASVRW